MSNQTCGIPEACICGRCGTIEPEPDCPDPQKEIERLTAQAEKYSPYSDGAMLAENLELKDRIAELEAEHEAGRFISRNSPNDTWERWVAACNVVHSRIGGEMSDNDY